MKIFFDTEFTGLHKSTTLVSIGLISEDRRTFYAELSDFDWKQVHADKSKFLLDNVINNLVCRKDESEEQYISGYRIGTKQEVAMMLRNWLKQFESVELVSDVCHYDMVLFIDLFGGAFDIPKNVCAACYDINQDIARKYGITSKEAFDKSREDILYQNYKEDKIQGDKHNALYDAKVIRELYQILNNVKFDK